MKKGEVHLVLLRSQHVLVLHGLNHVGVSECVGAAKKCEEYFDSYAFEYYFKCSVRGKEACTNCVPVVTLHTTKFQPAQHNSALPSTNTIPYELKSDSEVWYQRI